MFAALNAIATDIARGQREAAQAAIDEVLRVVARRTDPASLQARIFAGAMARTLDARAAHEANLYLRNYTVPQIRLFDLLASEVPLVSLAREVGNRMLIPACLGHEELLLVDIGIGSGTQEAALIRSLAVHPDAPRAITVIGIEVSTESLAVAAENLRAAERDTGISVRLIPLPCAVDAMTAEQWSWIASMPQPKVALSSFAFHHIGSHEGMESRDRVLRHLRALGVQAFLLTEPDSDHLQADYAARFAQAWRHFGATYAVLDRLSLDPTDRDALKAAFFGREIADILGTVEGVRAERHEDVHTWWSRLSAAGFAPASSPRPWLQTLTAPVIQAEDRGTHVSIAHGGVGIVAVMLARVAGK